VEHKTVVEIVKKWLENQYPPPKQVGQSDVDLVVNTIQTVENKMLVTNHLQVECKKTEDDFYEGIGLMEER